MPSITSRSAIRLAILILLALLVGGCGGDSASPTAAPTTATTVAPTTTSIPLLGAKENGTMLYEAGDSGKQIRADYG
jgi:ABC-type glycerol-3-phosphate transport system substrate-binding protein